MDWSSEIGCEGGPVLVANFADFREWSGAEPFPPDRHTELLFYSPFTHELPDRFRANGDNGHHYFQADNPAALAEELLAACLERFPGSTVQAGEGHWTVVRPDGKQLHASLEPSSEYALATRQLAEQSIHRFGSNCACHLWSVEPGIVRIEVRRRHSELLLAQVTFADEPADEDAAYAHARLAKLPAADDDVHFEVRHEASREAAGPQGLTRVACDGGPASPQGLTRVACDGGPAGPVIVAWSPASYRDLDAPIELDRLGDGRPGLELNLATAGSGAAIWLRPGSYVARTGAHESETWGVSWCVFTGSDYNACQKLPDRQSG
ncbi:MAG: hypothetical protein KDB14_09745 [Planctomycetales bacterium]|nr:hypothetical protein [Planctomycetales bacterium]